MKLKESFEECQKLPPQVLQKELSKAISKLLDKSGEAS